MRTRIPLAVVAALAVGAAGCGDEKKCPSESPEVRNLPASCDVQVGAVVNYPLRLCPTCNQVLTGCSVDMRGASATGGTIFLDPTVEACESASSCGPTCNVSPATCSFTPPTSNADVIYTVQVYDPATGQPKSGQLRTVSSSPSCAL